MKARKPTPKSRKAPAKLSPKRKPSKQPSKTQRAHRVLQQTPARASLQPIVRSEAWDLRGSRRNLAMATAIDVQQNLTVVSWMVQTHLDYVCNFAFSSRSGDLDYDQYLNAYFKAHTTKQVFDVQRRFSLPSMFRSFVSGKEYFGDALITKASLGRGQLFESYNIAKGSVDPLLTGDKRARAQAEVDALDENGLVLDEYGAVLAYGIATGESTGVLVHRMLVPYDQAIYDGAFVRPSCTRPPSPLLPALAFARDFLDNTNYRLIRAKIEAMFGLVLFRDHNLVGNHDFAYGRNPVGGASPDATNNGNTSVPMLDYELRPGLKLELEKGEDAKFLESTTPSANWLEFSKELIRLILAAKRIPYSLWDSKGATYSAQRGDFNRYRISCREEQATNKAAYREACDHIFSWGFASGELELPPGMTDVADLQYELVPQGTFILDEPKESAAIQQQVAAGHRTNEDACHALGLGDFYEITQRLAREQEFQRSLGVQVVLGIPGQPVSTDEPVDEETASVQQESPSGTKKEDGNE